MQDRYVYPSTPGFFLIVAEVWLGIAGKLRPLQGKIWRVSTAGVIGGAFIVFLAVVSVGRSSVWVSSRALFEDAVAREPRASYARWCLGSTYRDMENYYKQMLADASVANPPNTQRVEKLREAVGAYHRHALRQWQLGIDACPDYPLFNLYLTMAEAVGDEYLRLGRKDLAEKYWSLCVAPPTETMDHAATRAKAMLSLAALRLEQRAPAEAYKLADQAMQLDPGDLVQLTRARAALLLLEDSGAPPVKPKAELLDQIRRDLQGVPPESAGYPAAQALAHNPLLTDSH